MNCQACYTKAPAVVCGFCLACAGKCISELREEVRRLQEEKNELVREQWQRGPGDRLAEVLTKDAAGE